MLKVDAALASSRFSVVATLGPQPILSAVAGSDPHTAHPSRPRAASPQGGLGDDSGSEAGLSPMRRAY